ncbi:MAG: AbrB/MazE/SpoVT family DNA-binding domain-containing protein [Thermomicrobiales bacterium]|jgi:AbrB family looped-hinge helix DNA binding protein
MTSIAKVQSRGQVTLPSQERKAIGLQPGDMVVVRQTGDQTLELKAIPRMTVQEMVERYGVDEPIDVERVRAEAEDDMAADFLRELGG